MTVQPSASRHSRFQQTTTDRSEPVVVVVPFITVVLYFSHTWTHSNHRLRFVAIGSSDSRLEKRPAVREQENRPSFVVVVVCRLSRSNFGRRRAGKQAKPDSTDSTVETRARSKVILPLETSYHTLADLLHISTHASRIINASLRIHWKCWRSPHVVR